MLTMEVIGFKVVLCLEAGATVLELKDMTTNLGPLGVCFVCDGWEKLDLCPSNSTLQKADFNILFIYCQLSMCPAYNLPNILPMMHSFDFCSLWEMSFIPLWLSPSC